MPLWKSLKEWFNPSVPAAAAPKKAKAKPKPKPPVKKKPKAPAKAVKKPVEKTPPIEVAEIKVDGKHAVKKPRKSKASVDKSVDSVIVEIKEEGK